MRWDNIYVNACATVLGRKYETKLAVAEGRYDQADYEADGYLAVRVAEGAERAVDLGVAAANKVLEQSTVDPDDIAIVIHSSYGPQCTGEIAQRRTCRPGRSRAGRLRWRSTSSPTAAWSHSMSRAAI